ncbi:Oidioi.mRNA.OKI2018_I69.chr1.g1001.t1.cds [Oikopleura dioica]|uniref:Oidioi.mRNA.OKI2018_I69.chr1.g1001.t1.cds n=1 Tax=Oikopleura dioica TaxID=34765 RepID=A0ABN7SQD4_OIKDI|nr:Oidioi.mRNA.OKI2018_I69.chr1.g1001.t1.cds [Oikopleura dioica]
MRDRSKRRSSSKSIVSSKGVPESVGWMEVMSKVRVEKAEIEEVEKAEPVWAEFYIEENAEIYDDLEVVYSDIKIESLRRKPTRRQKSSPLIDNMTEKLFDNIFEEALHVEIEDDELYEMLLSRGTADEDLTEKLSNCTVLAENLNNRLQKLNENLDKQLAQEPVDAKENKKQLEPYRTPSPTKFVVPKTAKPIRSLSVPGSYLRPSKKKEIMPDNDYYEEDQTPLNSELTLLSSFTDCNRPASHSLSDISSRVSVRDLRRKFEKSAE